MMRTNNNRNTGTGTVPSRPGPASALSLRLLAAALLLSAWIPAGAEAQMAAAAEKCLTCHSMPALSKTMGDGEKLGLHVSREAFANSVHARMGCQTCHADVNPSAHPAPKPYASVREYTLAKSNSCKTCHKAKYEQYEGSIHARMVSAGDAQAPVCSSCHNVHGQQKVASIATYGGEVCRNCHESIFTAYESSMHGQARVGSGHLEAPICADCHTAHKVQAVSSSDRVKAACLDCHEGIEGVHKEWLPNSGLHLQAVACPACHSPMAELGVDLRLYDKKSGQLVAETLEDPRFMAMAREKDTAGDGLDPMELWGLVRAANREGVDTSVILHGRLEVRGVDAHQLALKSQAVRQCDTCHQQGSGAFNNVTVSVTGEDGRRIRYDADKDTLTSVVSVDSVGGFYTAGGTRIRLLDGLLALALMAGVGIPLTHFSVRKWFKSKK